MVKRSMYPAQSLEAQRYHEQVTNDDDSLYYELERPQNIYEPIPGELEVTEKVLILSF